MTRFWLKPINDLPKSPRVYFFAAVFILRQLLVSSNQPSSLLLKNTPWKFLTASLSLLPTATACSNPIQAVFTLALSTASTADSKAAVSHCSRYLMREKPADLNTLLSSSAPVLRFCRVWKCLHQVVRFERRTTEWSAWVQDCSQDFTDLENGTFDFREEKDFDNRIRW